jgi:hypothetical protein
MLLQLLFCLLVTQTIYSSPIDNPPWLVEMSTFPKSYTFRNEVYNHIFRYRGKLMTRQDAYNLWFDCVKAKQEKLLAGGSILTKEGHAYCHRLGHRITKEQRARLNPLQPKLFDVESITVPSRDLFLEQYSLLSRPVVMEKLATIMVPSFNKSITKSDTATISTSSTPHHPLPPPPTTTTDTSYATTNIHNAATVKSCLLQHTNLQAFSLQNVCNKALIDSYFVPSFMMNDAIQSIRYKMSGIEGESELKTPEWPSIWQTTEHIRSMPLTQAPHGAHTIHVVLQGVIRARLYAPQEHLKLHPHVQKGGRRIYKGVQQDETYMYKTVIVSAPNGLFVPSGFVYEWETDYNKEEKNIVISHGFVDAGALNHFKDEGELDWNHPSFTSTLNPTAATPLPSGTTYKHTSRMLSNMHGKNVPFPRTVSKSIVSWSEYSRQNSFSNSDGNRETQDKKKEQSSKGNQYREWRMQKIWEKRMLNLIPATPTIENLLHVGWKYIKIRISLPYDKESTFHSIHQGFMMTWSLMNNYTSMKDTNSTGSHQMTMRDHCKRETQETPPPMAVTYYVCSCNILQPSTHYVIRLATVTSTSIGSSSAAVAATTKTLSVPPMLETPSSCGVKFVTYTNVDGASANTPEICVSVRSPNDNGGRPINALVYRWRHFGKYHTYTQKPWRFKVTYEELKHVNSVAPSIQRTLYNVVPNTVILVQVAVENDIGIGEWSEGVLINTTVTGYESHQSFTVHETSLSPDFIGVNEVKEEFLPLHVQQRRQLKDNGNNFDGVDLTKVGVLSPRTHTLNIVLKDGNNLINRAINGWRLHHAPSSHDVRAALIIADPMDASEEEFYNDITGKIVMIERGGGIPFRDKVRRAQIAGALGVIIMDNTGKCTEEWNQGCVPGGSKHNGEGFAREDKITSWEGINTPTLMITGDDAEVIKGFIGSPLM